LTKNLKKKKPGKKSRTKNQDINPDKNQVRNLVFKICFLLIWLSAFVYSDRVWAQNFDLPFKNGEYARYGAYYNLNFIWIQSGDVEFDADTVQYKQQKAWHLKATGKSLKAYDLFFTVRDTFETFCNFNTFRPIFSSRVMNHAKVNSVHQYWFDYSSGNILTKIKQAEKPVFQARLPLPGNTFDLLATAYNFRMYDYDKLFVGQKVPYRMVIDKQVDDLFFRYLGKENVKTRNGKEYRCQKVSVYLLQGDFFPEGEYMKIWFTDDKNHLPVQVETKVLLGSVKALLLETKEMKYPLTSQIK